MQFDEDEHLTGIRHAIREICADLGDEYWRSAINQSALEKAVRGGEEFMRLNREFHTLIADASANRPLAALWSALSAIADGHEAGVRYTPGTFGGMIEARRRIAAAVEPGGGAEAARIMTAHLEATRAYVARYYPHLLDDPVTLVSGVS